MRLISAGWRGEMSCSSVVVLVLFGKDHPTPPPGFVYDGGAAAAWLNTQGCPTVHLRGFED